MGSERDYREGTPPPDTAGGEGPASMAPGDEVPPGAPASGEHLCRACRGTGRGDDDGPCPECDGTGRVIVAISAGP